MKKLLNILIVSALLLGGATGCVSSKRLAPDGIYKKDSVLFNVDDSYARTRLMLDVIFQWEANMLPNTFPKLRVAMNKVRLASIKADQEFHQMRTAYINAPTVQNQQSLSIALTRYLAVLTKSTELYVKE